ncbi:MULTISPECIES: transcription-repair coupling factor [unclassified Sphaerochaeta]|jgi:transcription-repair coupling factor (superfamily II helicase)|uniref:transcription-repair coupling factor n=1 Tax=unclassified Sphaerochaeta TaxID=2637943 RepID=UPI0025E8E778|nr:transcription-repair coupling factor [Sphaerochaeta sp. UBA5856]
MALMQTPISTLVQSYIKSSNAYKAYGAGSNHLAIQGLEGYPLAQFLRLISRKHAGRVWAVCPTEESAQQLLKDSGFSVNGTGVMQTPLSNNETRIVYLSGNGRKLYTPFNADNVEYDQLNRLMQIQEMKQGVVVTHLRPFVSPLVSPATLKQASLTIKVGSVFDTASFSRLLANAGYLHTVSTSAMGEYSMRGEVLDIFPYESEYPYRIYADWDTVGKIARYNPITQESITTVGKLTLSLVDATSELATTSIGEYLTDDDLFCFIGDQRLATSYHSLQVEAKALYRQAFLEDREAKKPDALLFDFPSFQKACRTSITLYDIAGQNQEAYRFDIEGPRSYFGNFTLLKEDLKSLDKQGWSIVIFTENQLQKQRLMQMLSAFPFLGWEDRAISGGFGIPSLKVVAICEHEIFGRRRQVIKTLQHTQTSALDSFVDLNEGDYVVHVNYGVGQFVKIDRVSSFDRERDFIKIAYADNEMLYVPIEQANLIQRYIGSDTGLPKKDKLGGQGWENKKAKARKNAEDLAKHLISLYAKRKNSVGFAFPKDTDWQLQFEASFPFDETADQLTCIEDIKEDMEKPIVMDRLVCGDVGYGKTEIAFRAVFKAVMGGKQVAFLAPTTILAEQHYQNFLKRVGNFPIRCAQLSRIVAKKEQKQTLIGLAEGKVDVLFGTHRILQKDIVYRDLGLLVVDEEQRFGVKDKERIKTLRASIDSLSLSATPIPRTLYMSLLKIRDMSLLATPPIARRPIQTYIGEYDEQTIVRAIRDEVGRGGQVFFLHNRIESLDEVVFQLTKLLPDVIIESAHGQMDSTKLEDTMRRFIHEGIQVLVSTTIIENGIDIPNVNTIIIDRADRYGLSQLYQLRGRVGRNDSQAYAYLFYPQGSALSEIALKRLKIISEHTELGSGFKVAMKDMELRGTGNLLGREQSGHLASVGLDMYIRILDEAIRDLQHEGVREEDKEVFLELDYTGFIPDTYIKAPSVKFDIYRKISSIVNDEQLQGLASELSDRFGPPPVEVANLLYIAEIKIICRKLSIIHLTDRKGVVAVEFGKVADLNVNKVMNLIALSNKSVWLDMRRMNVMYMKTDAVSLKDKALFLMEKLQRLI